MRRIAIFTLATALALAAAPALAQAQTFTVNSTGDWTPQTADMLDCAGATNTCTLRAAIASANALNNGSTIVFGPGLSGATIPLTAGSLPVTGAMSIQGPGAGSLTISGAAGVDDGIIQDTATGTVSISGLTLADGTASDGLFDQQGGGGIQQTAGTLNVTGVTFLSNTSGSGNDGGALYAAGAATNIASSTFSANSAGGGIESNEGGAIYLDAGALTVSGSTFANNSATDDGGAIEGDGGAVSVTGSTFISNSATDTGANGGAIDLDDGTLTVTSSQFTGNTASQDGSAINVENSSTLTISGSHFTSNTSQLGGPAISVLATLDLSSSLVENNAGPNYGGVAAMTGYLTNVVITGNASSDTTYDCESDNGCSGGLGLRNGTLVGTTVTGNTAAGGDTPNCDFVGTVVDGGGNTLAADCTVS